MLNTISSDIRYVAICFIPFLLPSAVDLLISGMLKDMFQMRLNKLRIIPDTSNVDSVDRFHYKMD